MNLDECKERIYQAQGRRDEIQKNLNNTIKTYQELKIKLPTIEQAQALIQKTAKETQEQLRFHVTDIVQTALDTCFPEQYDFVMEFDIKRGRTECLFQLEGEGSARYNPMDANGGGVIDIISFALRLSAWCLARTDNVIVLDEPFKFLSAGLRPLAGEILKNLSNRLQLQIILVTHMEEFIDVADKVFTVRKDTSSGVSRVSSTL